MLDGIVIEYLENGNKTSISNYKNGKLEGEKLSYYKVICQIVLMKKFRL